MGISPFLRDVLGIEEGADQPTLTVHVHPLPKGSYVRLRPLEAGYDPEDWKALLERHMRNTFTTLTSGEILTIPHGREEYKFLIDKVSPAGEGICIIDTDIEVDIEALNEEQARETLRRKQEKNTKAPGTKDGSSIGGDIKIDQQSTGQVIPGDYVDYTLAGWDRELGINIELETADPTHLDLFLSPFSSRQRNRPRDSKHLFADISERLTKRICIEHINTELTDAEAIYVSVRGYSEDTNSQKSQIPLPFTLRALPLSMQPRENGSHPEARATNGNPDESQCKNCRQWVPKRTMMLHENFCYRNNVLCPKCNEVFQKSSMEWKSHWHCEHDDAYGSTPESQLKHDAFAHTPQICTDCEYQTKNMSELARHRTSTCPRKTILCKFCHLLVPQQGPDDLDANEPEVILSGLTPHELSDGARTTECHMCGKIVRLRDMNTHTKHHNLERLTRITPRLCRNVNCGRTLDGIGLSGEVKRPQPSMNDVGLCDTCYGPLYISSFDPEGKALRRRVERRYLTQLLTGCGKDWCRNEYCKPARQYLGLDKPNDPVTSKTALSMIKPILIDLLHSTHSLHFCTDESSQRRRTIAEMIAAEGHGDKEGKASGYTLPWCIGALEAENGDLGKARQWLHNWAPTRAETEGRR